MKCKISITTFFIFLLISAQTFGQIADSVVSVSLLALGDVNLGRTVGQEILKGKIDYPFEKFGEIFSRADLIFANLECPVTDQNGETQSPKSNIIFCAPPTAATTLKRAGISVVSTANNHAYDYGLKGLQETIIFLNQAEVPFVGTVSDSGFEFTPVILERNNIRIGFVAYTQTVNIRSKWNKLISMFDSVRAKREIFELKPKVDFVIASYHGGDEYKDIPGDKADRELKLLSEFGANVVLGHHPHVPNGIELYQGSIIFHSLGNAVFNQPQRFWTQRSFAVLINFSKWNEKKEISSIELIPFRPGYQLKADLSQIEEKELMDRVQLLSTVKINQAKRGYFVEQNAAN